MYENEKAEEANQENKTNFASTPHGAIKGPAMRANLRERVANSLHRAETEAVKAHACRELAQLFEENPEVARILELLEALTLEVLTP